MGEPAGVSVGSAGAHSVGVGAGSVEAGDLRSVVGGVGDPRRSLRCNKFRKENTSIENVVPAPLTLDQRRYARLDRFLLYLMTAELSYFVLLMLAGFIIIVLVLVAHLSPRFINDPLGGLLPVLLYIVALPVNLIAGLAGLVLNIRTRHQGYPGTGHLLNWIFIVATAWLFILAFIFIFQSLPYRAD